MNAVNSAVNRKARATSDEAGEGVMTGIPERGALLLNSMESESQDDASAMGTKDTSMHPPDTVASNSEVQQEAKVVDEEKASNESPTPSVQRSKSESESDTSSRKKTKERKGFLGSILLRKKGERESGRSASSTPDAERVSPSSSDASSSKKGSRWGWEWKSESQEVKEQKAKAFLDTLL